MLDPDVVYLNHGAFGACPRVVHEEYQRFQRTLETQPTRFLQRDLPKLMREARAALADFVGAAASDVVFVTNPTYAVNEIARSLDLGPGDEVVTTNHEYGACRNAWQYMSERSGFAVVEARLPATIDDEAAVDSVLGMVTSRTRVIFVSHVTSPTALTFPVGEICRRARELEILTVIDGAHAPGQLELDVERLGADFYVGACHKWLCAPKGTSFLYAGRDVQPVLEPLIVGWGWGDRKKVDSGSDYLDIHEWLGTHDPSAYLTVPSAIAFQVTHDWPTVRARCHDLAIEVVEQASRIAGISRVHDDDRFVQMALLELHGPPWESQGAADIQRRLLDDFRVEVPGVTWNDPNGRARTFVRVSIQAYNTTRDVERLVDALNSVGAS